MAAKECASDEDRLSARVRWSHEAVHLNNAPMPTVLLDTNIWGRLVDEDQVEPLRKESKASDAQIVIAPAVVYELLRTNDPNRQRALAKAATLGTWQRVMTEVYEECNDLVQVLRRRRPHWLRPDPDLARFFELKADWTGGRGFWHRARTKPAQEAGYLKSLEGDNIDHARSEAKTHRQNLSELHFDSVDLSDIKAAPQSHWPGWDGTPVEAWRLESAALWWDALAVMRHPAYLDWLGPLLDLAEIHKSRKSFNEFWLYEVGVEELPREWLRWAIRFLHGLRKVTPGTPGDVQISLYACAVDVVVSGDRTFIDVLNKAGVEAPSEIGRGMVISQDEELPAAIIEAANSASVRPE